MNKKIQFLVMDVDGTLTDGKIYMGKTGEICKAFNIKDGCGIHDIVLADNIKPVVITGRRSEIVLKRCKEIGIMDIYQGVENKIEKLYSITSDLSAVAYIGDDINDLLCIKSVKEAGGITACPKDAVKEIKDIVDFVAAHDGGNGAVRDFIDWLVC